VVVVPRPRLAILVDRFEGRLGYVEPDFLVQLTDGRLPGRLVHPHRSARQPLRSSLAKALLHEQQLAVGVVHDHDGPVGTVKITYTNQRDAAWNYASTAGYRE